MITFPQVAFQHSPSKLSTCLKVLIKTNVFPLTWRNDRLQFKLCSLKMLGYCIIIFVLWIIQCAVNILAGPQVYEWMLKYFQSSNTIDMFSSIGKCFYLRIASLAITAVSQSLTNWYIFNIVGFNSVQNWGKWLDFSVKNN